MRLILAFIVLGFDISTILPLCRWLPVGTLGLWLVLNETCANLGIASSVYLYLYVPLFRLCSFLFDHFKFVARYPCVLLTLSNESSGVVGLPSIHSTMMVNCRHATILYANGYLPVYE